jgi:hypothetical protein
MNYVFLFVEICVQETFGTNQKAIYLGLAALYITMPLELFEEWHLAGQEGLSGSKVMAEKLDKCGTSTKRNLDS